MSEQPNIVFINVDQLGVLETQFDSLAEHLHTPNIDRIRENGVSFDRSYATEPLCCPARTSWWTGLYPSEHGAVILNFPCHDGLTDLGSYLGKNGYNVFHVGKWHSPGINVRQSFQVLHEGSWWGEITDPAVTTAARSLIRSCKQPYFLNIAYLNPHDICLTWNDLQGEEVPFPIADRVLSLDDLPPLPKSFAYDSAETKICRTHMREARATHFSEQQWRYYLYQYFRHIEMVDREIGAVLDEIAASTECDNTLIIFTSDHGEGMGCHQAVGKSKLYEETVRVPFTIASLGDKIPLQKGTTNKEHFVSGVDFVPTVCDFAGTTPFPSQGLSLRPLTCGQPVSDWRDYVYAETYVFGRMIRTNQYKYIMEYVPQQVDRLHPPSLATHEVESEQLFDLTADPGETRNLAGDESKLSVLQEFRNLLHQHEQSLCQKPFDDPNQQLESFIAKLI